MRRRLATMTVLLALAGAAAMAQSTDERTSAITHELMSPFCPGLLLADCPSDYARVLREEIARRVASGEASRSIEDDLIVRYGDQIRTIPSFHGVGVLAWVGPPIAGALGLLAVALALRSAMRADAAHDRQLQPPAEVEDRVLNERLQYELEDMD